MFDPRTHHIAPDISRFPVIDFRGKGKASRNVDIDESRQVVDGKQIQFHDLATMAAPRWPASWIGGCEATSSRVRRDCGSSSV